MKISGAIFDMDGTLLDSMPYWSNVGRDYLIERSITPRPNFRKEIFALSLPQCAEYFQREYAISDTIDVIMQDINNIAERFYMNAVLLKSGVAEFLDELSHRGVKMCVATATDNYLAEAALQRLGVRDYFAAIFTCTEVGVGKENPLIFECARKLLGTEIESTVVFEDAYHAIRTTRSAGFPVVAIYDAASANYEQEIRALATVYIKSFTEARELLD